MSEASARIKAVLQRYPADVVYEFWENFCDEQDIREPAADLGLMADKLAEFAKSSIDAAGDLITELDIIQEEQESDE